MNKLIIIESPGKIEKLYKILGNGYTIKASRGHFRDLDKNSLSIDVNNNFKPNYILSEDKIKLIKELRDLTKNHKVIIATDNDREGEGIAAGLVSVLNIHNYDRIVFSEITSKALKNALANPTKINQNLANAQEVRRILDRLMGYLISPVLWKYLNKDAKSAGRVQSVVNKIIIDKEEEIKSAVSTPYFKTIGIFNDLFGTLDKYFVSNFPVLDQLTNISLYNISTRLSIFVISCVLSSPERSLIKIYKAFLLNTSIFSLVLNSSNIESAIKHSVCVSNSRTLVTLVFFLFITSIVN